MIKIIYFIPALPFTILFVYFAIGTSIEVTPIAWIMNILLILSGMLMYKTSDVVVVLKRLQVLY